MKKNLFSCSFLGNIIFMLSAVLCGCNETGTFSEKKYTPVYVYLSTTPYVGESSMSDFVDYPSDLVRLGLRGTVKEVKTTSAAEMVQKFNEDGNLTSQGLWFDSSHRFGDEYKREYDDEGKLTKLYNVRNKWKAKVYAYDEWNRLIECRADDYTRTYQYTGEDRSCYVVNTECKKESEVALYFFSGIRDNKKLVFDTYDKPEGYRMMDGNTRMHFQTECPMTELCKRFTKIYYPDSRYYKNKIDSIVNTYNVSYNDKEDMEQYLIHSVEYPSGKAWDCQIDYSYEYDEHDNWVVLKLYCSELRKLLGDFIIIQKDAEGKTYTEDRRVISYYETEVGNEEIH